MAFAVMFSTLSFTVESHYCGNRLVDTAIFSNAKGCGMETGAKELIIKNCCVNKIEVIKGQDELKLNDFDNLNLNQQLVLTTFVFTYINLFESLPKQTVPHEEYAPPNIVINIQLLDDVFLI